MSVTARAKTLSHQTSETRHAEFVASLAITTLPWKWRKDHMAALSCLSVMSFSRGWMSVFISIPFCSTTAKPGVNPRHHMTTNRKWGINPLHINSMASPNFMPTDSRSSLYGGSILSTWAWDEGAAVKCHSEHRPTPVLLSVGPLSVPKGSVHVYCTYYML